MALELKGRIVLVLPEQTGTSRTTGNPWKAQTYIIETPGQYPRKAAFEVFGEDRIAQMAIKEGEELTVSVDIDAREYQGRWFNTVRAWKVERGIQPDAQPVVAAPAAEAAAPAAVQPAAGYAAPAQTSQEDAMADDLPF